MALKIPRNTWKAIIAGAVFGLVLHGFFRYLYDPLFFTAPDADITLRNCTDICKLYGDVTVDWDGRFRVVQKDGTIILLETKDLLGFSWSH